MFYQKLDYLMKLTNTQNSKLAHAINLDAAHVSRLRSGQRALPKNPSFLKPLCIYISKQIKMDYQKKAVCDILKTAEWSADDGKSAEILENWLIGKTAASADIGVILHSLTSPTPAVASVSGNKEKDNEKAKDVLQSPKDYYYGVEGKREAVLQFFNLIQKEKEPQTLLLYSDEEMGWLYEDPKFAKCWANEFIKVQKCGNRVRIIHSVGRDLNELIEAVSKWVPVYMTGMIEPYYYPKLRDGIFQRTMFIAPNTAAIISSSVTKKSDGMLNELITDKNAVSALTKEFDNYFSLCRPLVHIVTEKNSRDLWEAWCTLLKADGDCICMGSMPPISVMPDEVADSMQKRTPESRISEIQRVVKAAFCNRENHRFTEIIPEQLEGLPQRALPCSDFFGASGISYTDEEYEKHCKSMSNAEKANADYEISRVKDVPPNLTVFCKEEHGVIMIKTDAPSVAFVFSEPNITNAFWDYLVSRKN